MEVRVWWKMVVWLLRVVLEIPKQLAGLFNPAIFVDEWRAY